MAGFITKLRKAHEKPISEKIDTKPLAIIAGVKKPETMSEAIARILDHSLNEEEWERVRGVEYDHSSDDFEDEADDSFGSFENGDIEHDDKGYFEDNKKSKKGGKSNARQHEGESIVVDNSDNGSDRNSLGTTQEPTINLTRDEQ